MSKFTQPIRILRKRSPQTSLAIAFLLVLTLGACIDPPPPHRAAPAYKPSASRIQSIPLAPLLVAVYAMSSGNVEQEVQGWSHAANQLAQVAVGERIETMARTMKFRVSRA